MEQASPPHLDHQGQEEYAVKEDILSQKLSVGRNISACTTQVSQTSPKTTGSPVRVKEPETQGSRHPSQDKAGTTSPLTHTSPGAHPTSGGLALDQELP